MNQIPWTREQWRVGSRVKLNVYDGDRPVCQCHSEDDAVQIVSARNAAPELFEALKEILQVSESWLRTYPWGADTITMARAALAKALGDSKRGGAA